MVSWWKHRSNELRRLHRASFDYGYVSRRRIVTFRERPVSLGLLIPASSAFRAGAADQPVNFSDYFPPPEEQGGWRSLLPAEGEPDDSQKVRIRDVGGVDWDTL